MEEKKIRNCEFLNYPLHLFDIILLDKLRYSGEKEKLDFKKEDPIDFFENLAR